MKIIWYYLFGEITNLGVLFWGSILVTIKDLSWARFPLGRIEKNRGRRLGVGKTKYLEIIIISEKVKDN